MSRDDAKRALGTDEHTGKIVTGGRLPRPLACADVFPVRQHHSQREDVFAHRAVTHGVGPRCPRRRHAADCRVRAGIDWKEQARIAQVLVQLFARHAGFDSDVEISGVDPKDRIQLAKIDTDTSLQCRDVAFKRRAYPNGIIGVRCPAQIRTISCTSSRVWGNTTASGAFGA